MQEDDQWKMVDRFLFITLRDHKAMAEFVSISIKDYPSISSKMVKFVCYSQTASDTTQVLSHTSAVEVLQCEDQSSIFNIELRMKKLSAWKPDADKSQEKILTNIVLFNLELMTQHILVYTYYYNIHIYTKSPFDYQFFW